MWVFGGLVTAICVLVGILYSDFKKNVGQGIKDLRKTIGSLEMEIKRNTDVQSAMITQVAIIATKVEAVEREFIRSFSEAQAKLRELEDEARYVGERCHAIVNALSAVYNTARMKSWPLPELELPQRARRRDS